MTGQRKGTTAKGSRAMSNMLKDLIKSREAIQCGATSDFGMIVPNTGKRLSYDIRI